MKFTCRRKMGLLTPPTNIYTLKLHRQSEVILTEKNSTQLDQAKLLLSKLNSKQKFNDRYMVMP